MKNGRRLSLLLSLFIGIAMHASDVYKQEITTLINQKFPDVYWQFCSSTTPSTIRLAFCPERTDLPTCMLKTVFTHKDVDYMLRKIDPNAAINIDGNMVRGFTVVILIPKGKNAVT